MNESPSTTDEQDRAQVARFLAGQADAATDLVERYHRRVYAVALKMLGNVQDAEDVAQTVFFNAFGKLRSYDPKYRFFSWIYRMTVNESLNALKRRRRTVTLEDLPIAVPGAPADRAAEVRDWLAQALASLKPEDRAVVVLSHFESLSYQEIATVLEIPVKTVKSRLYTARDRLRTALSERAGT